MIRQLLTTFARHLSLDSFRKVSTNTAMSGVAQVGDTFTNSIGMKLTYIPAGEFTMGTLLRPEEVLKRYGGDEADLAWYQWQRPLHQVKLTRPFLMGVTEVTRGQFAQFVHATGYRTTAEVQGTGWGMAATGYRKTAGLTWRNTGFEQTDSHPVVVVSWDDAVAFCKWLCKKERRSYRLPTESEWEYACRAGSFSEFAWGDAIDECKLYANVMDQSLRRWLKKKFEKTYDYVAPWDDGFGNTSPVGMFCANQWGLYDMHGNIDEWCRDWYGDYLADEVTDPTGPPNGTFRVLRGGSWFSTPRQCRAANRGRNSPDYRSDGLGFRLVLV